MAAIDINNISKKYGNVPALDKISFSVEKGEIFGLIGPDGAGKTTLFRILATLLTQFINNGAVGVALMPVIYSYCTNMGVGPELPVIMVVMGVHLAFLTPAASSSAALLHGNEWASTKSIWKSSPIVILLSWILMSAVITIIGSAIF